MLTLKDIDAAVQSAISNAKRPSEIGPAIAAVVARELVKELGKLEERLAQLERDALVWAGAYDPGKTYAANDLVQRGAAVWLVLVATKAGDMPGSSPSFRKIAESKA